VDDQYQIDVNRIEGAITRRTKAILPVHLTGCPADMSAINDIAEKRNLHVVEDAAQAVCAEVDGKRVGHLGIAGEFSFHPLKNLNGWGDAGAVVTNHKWLADKIAKWRNHGMKNRDEVEFFSYNERMHSTAAAVLNCLVGHAEDITEKRIANAALYDKLLLPMSRFVALPPRPKNKKQVYHTYVIRVLDGKRDDLQKFLLEEKGIDTKVHYPIPIHLQEAARHLGYRHGDFPNCERQSREILTLPVHQYLTEDQIVYVAESISDFFTSFVATKRNKF
ncbi:MAG: DegT/DnrJ/EryC1/StrS family aminotransferase, partial [Patescibacteria group bacterium]